MIKGNIDTIAKSQGNVKVTVLDSDKVRCVIEEHNSGTAELSEFLRDALIGKSLNERLPDRIIPCKLNSSERSENNLEDILTYGIQLNAREAAGTIDKTASAKLKFLIPSTILTSGSLVSGFKLYNGKNANATHYASVVLSSDITITNNTSILVEWTLSVSPK